MSEIQRYGMDGFMDFLKPVVIEAYPVGDGLGTVPEGEYVSKQTYDALATRLAAAEQLIEQACEAVKESSGCHRDHLVLSITRQKETLNQYRDELPKAQAESGTLRGQVALLQLALKQEEARRVFVQGQMAAMEQERDAWKHSHECSEATLRALMDQVPSEQYSLDPLMLERLQGYVKQAEIGTQQIADLKQQLSTLTQALAQARSALESCKDFITKNKRGNEYMWMEDVIDIGLAVPAAGGGCEYCSAHGATFLDGCTDPIHYPKPAAAPAPTPGLEVPAPESHHFGWRYDETNLPSPPGPKGLVWTTERPTVPGGYGRTHPEFGTDVVTINEHMCTEPYHKPIHEYSDEYRWCGPIVLPEPKGA